MAKNIFKFAVMMFLLLISYPAYAWKCDRDCPTDVFSGKYECLAWKKLNCEGDEIDATGCGSGWNKRLVRDSYGGADFTAACDRHDRCYETCGTTQKDCDKTFRDDLKSECRSTYTSVWHEIQKRACLKVADAYYEAVKQAGEDAFRNAQRTCVGAANALATLETRRGHYFSVGDGVGPDVKVQESHSTDPQVSDELFTIVKPDGEILRDGDKVLLKTRRGYYFSVWDSIGPDVNVQESHSTDLQVSDELFTIIKLAGGVIRTGDKILFKTRKGFYFSVWDSVGPVVKVQETHSTDHQISDEMFTIRFY